MNKNNLTLGITVSINMNSYNSSSFSTDAITVSAFISPILRQTFFLRQFLRRPPLVCALCSRTVRPPLATTLLSPNVHKCQNKRHESSSSGRPSSLKYKSMVSKWKIQIPRNFYGRIIFFLFRLLGPTL